MSAKSKFYMVTGKQIVPIYLWETLNDFYVNSKRCVKKMLRFRERNSSKYYPELPCVVSKSLISKYQRQNVKSVKSLVIPICGDKGKIVKWDGKNVRIPALFKKESFQLFPVKPVSGNIACVEFKRIKGEWWMFYSYETVSSSTVLDTGVIGVDFNSSGNVAVLADNASGKVRKLGPDVTLWKENFKRRKRRLQKARKYGLLRKLKRKQSNRTRDINHKVSREIVNYAASQRKPIVLEDISLKSGKKFARDARKNNWTFHQLGQFIQYKASLCGIPVYKVPPYNTSRECSRCGRINEVVGKKYSCPCGHHDHRDVNAAFNIGARFIKDPLRAKVFNGSRWVKRNHIEKREVYVNSTVSTDNERELSAGPIGDPQTGKRG